MFLDSANFLMLPFLRQYLDLVFHQVKLNMVIIFSFTPLCQFGDPERFSRPQQCQKDETGKCAFFIAV